VTTPASPDAPKRLIKDELLECPECGARIAVGKYMPLQRAGRPDYCRAELAEVSQDEANEMLSNFLADEEDRL
jgi:hypothetical protein